MRTSSLVTVFLLVLLLLLLCCAQQNGSTVMYWKLNATMNWTDAFSSCAVLNGSLPAIVSADQNVLFTNATAGNRSWIAGTRLTPFSTDSSQFRFPHAG